MNQPARQPIEDIFMSFGVIAQHRKMLSTAPVVPSKNVFAFGVANLTSKPITTKTAELDRNISLMAKSGSDLTEVRQYGDGDGGLNPATYNGGILADTVSSGLTARSFEAFEPTNEGGYKH